MKLIYSLVIILFVSISYSQTNVHILKENIDYEYLSSTDTQDIYYKIEKHSEIGNETYLWLKEIPKDKKQYTLTYMTIRCDSKNYDLEEYITYSNKDKIIKSGNMEVYHRKIFPESIAEQLSKLICK